MHVVVHRLCCMSELTHNIENYDEISDIVRRFCAEQLYEAERSLRPWINGSFGDINPGHMSAYISILRELARLYNAHKPPRPDGQLLDAAEVAKMLETAQREAEARIQAAVLETEQRIRHELAAASAKSIESAKTAALTKLQELQERTRG